MCQPSILKTEDRTEAERCFRKPITIARAQDTRGLELRAAVSLARLLNEQGQREEACDLLAPLYGWFTEGFDTPDLKEAKALLRDTRRLADYAFGSLNLVGNEGPELALQRRFERGKAKSALPPISDLDLNGRIDVDPERTNTQDRALCPRVCGAPTATVPLAAYGPASG